MAWNALESQTRLDHQPIYADMVQTRSWGLLHQPGSLTYAHHDAAGQHTWALNMCGCKVGRVLSCFRLTSSVIFPCVVLVAYLPAPLSSSLTRPRIRVSGLVGSDPDPLFSLEHPLTHIPFTRYHATEA